MNINYLYSIIDLYLSKETDNKKTNLSILKEDDQLHFSFNMDKQDNEVTSFTLPIKSVLDNNNLSTFIKKFKQNFIIIDEKYEYNKNQETCYYYIQFNNGRLLSFRSFSVIEINNIRNIIYNIDIQKDEIRIIFDDQEEDNQTSNLRLQEAGFINHITVFLVGIWFLDILVLSLWVFKSFIK